MDYCKTCVYYPPSSCDGKPCTQCDPESPFYNCYVNKEDYSTKERMDERLAMMHKLYPDAKPRTNADRIRSMTDEELANWLAKITDCGECHVCGHVKCMTSEESCACAWLEWLKREATE